MSARQNCLADPSVIYFALFWLLFAIFDANALLIANPLWFAHFNPDGNYLVLGRVFASRAEGFMSYGGILGEYDGGIWTPYISAIGLQGLIFDLLTPSTIANEHVIGFLRVLVAATTASAFAGVVMWFGRSVGLAAAIGVMAGLLYSPWLVVFGNHLYWVLGTLFLPFLVTAWGFHYAERRGDQRIGPIMLVLFIAFFIKCACGYEYLTTLVFSAWAPIVYYAIVNRWKFRRFATATLTAGLVCVLAFVLAVAINAELIANAFHKDFASAVIDLLKRFDVRLGMPIPVTDVKVESSKSLDTSVWKIVYMYWRGFIGGPYISRRIFAWPPTFGEMSLVATLVGTWVFGFAYRRQALTCHSRRLIALTLAMAVGYIGALSWNIIVIQHAYIHHHLNHILWYLPFALFFFALCGEVVNRFIQYKFKKNASDT